MLKTSYKLSHIWHRVIEMLRIFFHDFWHFVWYIFRTVLSSFLCSNSTSVCPERSVRGNKVQSSVEDRTITFKRSAFVLFWDTFVGSFLTDFKYTEGNVMSRYAKITPRYVQSPRWEDQALFQFIFTWFEKQTKGTNCYTVWSENKRWIS